MTTTPTLTELIREHIDRTGESYEQIATRAGLSKPLIGRLAILTEPYAVNASTPPKLAAGLRLPVDLVQRAAARTAGFDAPPEPEGSASQTRIASLAADLTPDDAETVLIIVQALVERRGR